MWACALLEIRSGVSKRSLLDVLIGVCQTNSALKEWWKYQRIISFLLSLSRERVYIAVSRVIPVSKGRSERKRERQRQTDREQERAKAYVRWSAITAALSYERPPVSVHGLSCNGGCIRWLGFYNPPDIFPCGSDGLSTWVAVLGALFLAETWRELLIHAGGLS